MTERNQTCNLGKELLGTQCCCICKYLKKTVSHPWIDNKPMSNQTGWACCPPNCDSVTPLWWEHCIGCELFEKRDE